MDTASIRPKKRTRVAIGIDSIPTTLVGRIVSFLPNSVSCISRKFQIGTLIEYKLLFFKLKATKSPLIPKLSEKEIKLIDGLDCETIYSIFRNIYASAKKYIPPRRLSEIYGMSYLDIPRFDAINKDCIEYRSLTISQFNVNANTDALILNLKFITFIPFLIGNLKKLETLKLENNFIVDLPYEIRELALLKKLFLGSNRLTSLEGLGSLKNLEELSAYCNKITEIPLSICSLPKLQQLSLYDNQIEQVPVEITGLTALKSIDLKDNNIGSVDPSIIKFLMHRGFSLP